MGESSCRTLAHQLPFLFVTCARVVKDHVRSSGIVLGRPDVPAWSKMAILNTARSHMFSSDRTILEYARDVWDIHQFVRATREGNPADLITPAPLTGAEVQDQLRAD